MHRRSLTLAAFASSAFFLPIGEAAAPTTLKYRIVQRMEQTIDASAMGQGEQKVMMGYSAYLTVELDDSASGHTVSVKVDSLRTDADAEPTFAAMLSQSDGASGSGFIYHGFVEGDDIGKGTVDVVVTQIRLCTTKTETKAMSEPFVKL